MGEEREGNAAVNTVNGVARSRLDAIERELETMRRTQCAAHDERIARVEDRLGEMREGLAQLRGELRLWAAIIAVLVPAVTHVLTWILTRLP